MNRAGLKPRSSSAVPKGTRFIYLRVPSAEALGYHLPSRTARLGRSNAHIYRQAQHSKPAIWPTPLMSLLSAGELPVKIVVPKPENKHRTATPNSRKSEALGHK